MDWAVSRFLAARGSIVDLMEGDMLARLEKAYLNILRVFILIAASIALIVACLAIISSAPFFASQLGFRGEAQGGDLARFMEEQRDYGSSSDYDADTGYSRTFTISGSLQETAKRLSAYAKTHHSIDLSTEKIEKSLAAAQEEFPLEYYGDYEESWETLSKQLAVAEGKPLSMEKLDELTYDEVIDKKLGVMDLTAICLSRDHKIPIKVFNMTRPGALLENVMGKQDGTLIR